MKTMKPNFFALLISSILLFTPNLFAKKMILLGDSLTEGYGVAKEAAFPALLEKKIKAAGLGWTVINAGISGSTSASGPSRIKWQLKSKPDLVVLALGANDGLRGLDVKSMEKNLSETIELTQKENVRVILAGMQMPPNYGEKYTKDFAAVFPRVAKKYKIKEIPFLLEGVAADPKLNLPDGIHPNEKGHEVLAEAMFKALKDVL
jgi:acyl-CoA thioesterase-1